jgi:hypothetical protein
MTNNCEDYASDNTQHVWPTASGWDVLTDCGARRTPACGNCPYRNQEDDALLYEELRGGIRKSRMPDLLSGDARLQARFNLRLVPCPAPSMSPSMSLCGQHQNTYACVAKGSTRRSPIRMTTWRRRRLQRAFPTEIPLDA